MKRRQFLAMSALTVLAKEAIASDQLNVDFSPETYEQALDSGKPFILDFYATW